MVGLVAMFESWLSGRMLDFRDGTTADWAATRAAIGRETPGRGVLCFGDSQIEYGVIPNRIESRTGLSTYNASVGAGNPIASYYLLQHALASGAQPEIAIVDFIPHTLRFAPQRTQFLWPEILGVRDAAEVAWTWGDARFFAGFLARKGFVSVRYRPGIRDVMAAYLAGQPESVAGRRRRIEDFLANRHANRGALVEPENLAFRGDPDYLANDLTPDRWKADPRLIAYVRGFFDLARSHGVRVYWVMAPFCPAIQSRRSAKGLDALYDRFADRLRKEYPEVIVVDGRGSGYGDDAFHDPIHLSRRGGEALSDDLADLLAQTSGSADTHQLVSLPLYRGRAAAPYIENSRRPMEMIGAGRNGSIRR